MTTSLNTTSKRSGSLSISCSASSALEASTCLFDSRDREGGEGLATSDIAHGVVIAHAAGLKRAISAAHFVDELLECYAVQRKLFRIGLDANLLRISAGNVGQPDIIGFDQFGLQLVPEFIQVLVGPSQPPPRASAKALARPRQHR